MLLGNIYDPTLVNEADVGGEQIRDSQFMYTS